jgi:hypothetical protein
MFDGLQQMLTFADTLLGMLIAAFFKYLLS